MEDMDTSRDQFILLHSHCAGMLQGVTSTSLDEDVEKLESMRCVKKQFLWGLDVMLPCSLVLSLNACTPKIREQIKHTQFSMVSAMSW